MAEGQSAQFGFKKQTAINTPATAPLTTTLLDRYNDTTGRMVTTGRPRIGAGLAPVFGGIVLGASPAFQGSGPLDLNTIAPFLEAAGRANASGVFTPVTTSANFGYFTADVIRVVGASPLQYAIRDCRLMRLGFMFMSGEEPRIEFVGLGGNVTDSTVVHTVPTSMAQPSPAETISSANAVVFGSTAYTVLDFQYFIEISLDNRRRPLGSLTPDDIRVTDIRPRAVLRIDCTAANWKRAFYGATDATAIGTLIATGALKWRFSVAGGADYIDFDWAAAEYVAEQPADVRAEEEQYVILGARPTGAVTETVVV
jgi:hypothetical protein